MFVTRKTIMQQQKFKCCAITWVNSAVAETAPQASEIADELINFNRKPTDLRRAKARYLCALDNRPSHSKNNETTTCHGSWKIFLANENKPDLPWSI